MYGELAILALFTFSFSLVATRPERTIFSGPIIFVTVGFIMGPFVLGWLQ